MKLNVFLGVLTLSFTFLSCKSKEPDDFDSLNSSSDWKLELSDPCTDNWQSNWFLDGKIAKVEQSDKGMNFIAGPVNRDDANHGVLWTKKVFKGDVKIEYNYTRTDSQVINVNILYIQASGIGVEPYDKDISKWNNLREIPTMSIYYNYMDPLHISYAAFPMVNDDPENDYVRVRKYPIKENQTFEKTEVPPAFYKTGLFLPNVTYKITVIKTNAKLFFKVNGGGLEKVFSWSLEEGQSPDEGRIGLRHMYTRSAQYSDFKVWTK